MKEEKENINFEEMMDNAVEIAIYSHAMTHIRCISNDEKMLEKEQFLEIKKIVEAATKKLEINND